MQALPTLKSTIRLAKGGRLITGAVTGGEFTVEASLTCRKPGNWAGNLTDAKTRKVFQKFDVSGISPREMLLHVLERAKRRAVEGHGGFGLDFSLRH